ncbi:MAG TPA: four-helix bundle copper-binding protein [Opitutaceae bacterium]|nr:four-helix bundle copper-binding protein [Opitutaceae bacterium]
MTTIENLLEGRSAASDPRSTDYADALNALAACAAACTICSDACLGETGHVEQLRGCITADLDCADVCETTARLLLRRTSTPNDLVHAQLHACALACQRCADECAAHAERHEHCRNCAKACRACQARCNHLLGVLGSEGTVEMTPTDEEIS